MKKETVYFATYWAPGPFFAESWTRDVDGDDPGKVPWPENAYCFTLHKRTDVVDGDHRYKGEPKQVGPRYYHPDSKVETLAEVKRNPDATDTLIRNMENNKWEKIVWSRWGNWPQTFDEKHDCVLEKR